MERTYLARDFVIEDRPIEELSNSPRGRFVWRIIVELKRKLYSPRRINSHRFYTLRLTLARQKAPHVKFSDFLRPVMKIYLFL